MWTRAYLKQRFSINKVSRPNWLYVFDKRGAIKKYRALGPVIYFEDARLRFDCLSSRVVL